MSNTEQPRVPVIAYAEPLEQIRYRLLVRISRRFGGWPLAIGVAEFVIFLITRNDFLASIGFFTVLAGTVSVAIGLVCITVYFLINRLDDPSLRKMVNRDTNWTIALLMSNFPVAFVCAWIGIALLDHHRHF